MDKAPRPKIVGGINVKVVTGCGNMYVQMGWCDGKLFEVFATLGRAGGCAMCFNESLTRAITTGLRCGVQVAEYVKQLRGARCPTPMPFPREDSVMSCPDAIGKILEAYGSLTTDSMIKLIQELNSLSNRQPEEEEASEREEAMKRVEILRAERERQGLV